MTTTALLAPPATEEPTPDAPECSRCHRPLSDPASIARLRGPDCWAREHPPAVRIPRPSADLDQDPLFDLPEETEMTDTDVKPTPPDTRLNGPIHRYFGLSYSNYLVLHRTLMQSMPVDWQFRMVACLEQLDAAFRHVEKPPYFQVLPAAESTYGELSEDQIKSLGVGEYESDPDEAERQFYDKDGHEHEQYDVLLVPLPGGDPVPHYNRGRTYIEPRTNA